VEVLIKVFPDTQMSSGELESDWLFIFPEAKAIKIRKNEQKETKKEIKSRLKSNNASENFSSFDLIFTSCIISPFSVIIIACLEQNQI